MAAVIRLSGVLVVLLAAACGAHDMVPMLMKHIERLDATIATMQDAHRAEIHRLDAIIATMQDAHRAEIQRLDAIIATMQDAHRAEIQRLDATIATIQDTHRAEIQRLEEKLVRQEAEYTRGIADLDRRLARTEEANGELRKELARCKDEDKQNRVQGDQQEQTDVPETGKSPNKITLDDRVPVLPEAGIARPRRALYEGSNVAFSAYMDHDVSGLGPGQTLIFNQVLLNDGNKYNKHTGIFTAPIAGVYSFSFFIGQRDANAESVALYVNSTNQVDAAVDTVHSTQDLQGGNTVNLKLGTNDVVYVRHHSGNGHVEGSGSRRLTTFSGFLIYPVEPMPIVGK